jgi:Spy/CpxP family protein refolding chaperone
MTRTKKIALIGLFAALPLAAVAHGPMGGPRAASAEEAREHAGRMADRALDRVDATDAQRARIDAILDENVPQMFEIHEDGAALREDGRALFAAKTVDGAKVEALRVQAVALFDEGSKVMAGMMVDIANVLTVEQRQDLAEDLAELRERRGPPGGPGFGGPEEGPGGGRLRDERR